MSLRIVAATREASQAFSETTLLGRSLQQPVHQGIARTIAFENSQGLSVVYNKALGSSDEDILLFCHDDLILPAEPFEPALKAALQRFDILGLAGNRRDENHLAWHSHPGGFGWDLPYLRGEARHGNASQFRKDVYGLCDVPVKLIDGALIAVNRSKLIDHGVQFDSRYQFHFYDLDFCREARKKGLTIGVIRLGCIHGSAGKFGDEQWQNQAKVFCHKWQHTDSKSAIQNHSIKTNFPPVEIKNEGPKSFEAGRVAYRIKDYKAAQDAFSQAVCEDPDHQWSWLQLANAQRKCGDVYTAIETLQTLTKKFPTFIQGWRNLGILHEQNDDPEQARNDYERMLAAEPANKESLNLLTELLIRTQSLDDAESLLRSATHAMGKQHQSSSLWLQLGRLMAKRGDSLRAFKALHNASLIDANNPDIQLPKVALLLEFAQPEAALETVNTLLKAHPNHPDALQRKAEILQFLSREQESLTICEQALAKDPERMDLLLLQIYAAKAICDWRDQDSQLAMIIKILKQRGADDSSVGEPHRPIPPFGLLKLPLPSTLMRQELDRWVLANGPGSAAFQAKPMKPVAHGFERPMRIGYLSADFRSHAMGLLLEGLFEAHDPDQAETFAYSISPIRDRLTDHFKATADHFHDLHGRRDGDSVEQIQRDDLDVLIDLSGLTTFSRPAIVCARPAPLLLGYLGFPGSQGAHYVDGILADDHLIPVDRTEDYSETVWRLPVGFVAKHRAALPGVTRSSLGLPEHAFVYCCFNRAEKITEEIFDCWLNILLAVSNSVLWMSLKPAAHRHLQARAVARGVDPNRLIVAAYQKPVERFISAMSCADLFLDTPEYNAGAIGVLALNAGLPLLTLPGQRFSSRMRASLCYSTGLSQMVMADLKAYEYRAIELAGSPHEIEKLKSHLQCQPENLPLFQQRRWVNDLVERIHRS